MSFEMRTCASCFIKTQENTEHVPTDSKNKSDGIEFYAKSEKPESANICNDQEAKEALEESICDSKSKKPTASKNSKSETIDITDQADEYRARVQRAIENMFSDEWECTKAYEIDASENTKTSKVDDKFYFEPYNPKTFCYMGPEREITCITANGTEIQKYRPTATVILTTPEEITEEEALHGVIDKQRINFPCNNTLMNPHSDIFTYEDGSQLINEYDGSRLVSQTQISYSEGYDPESPKSGDVKKKIHYEYNSDGSYTVDKDSSTYTEFKDSNGNVEGGFLTEAVNIYFNHIAYDADGNRYISGQPGEEGQKYKEIWKKTHGLSY